MKIEKYATEENEKIFLSLTVQDKFEVEVEVVPFNIWHMKANFI
jgi:hypothetical protein